jgi:hypothetical protein
MMLVTKINLIMMQTLHPFHPGIFSGNDAAVETLRLYGDVRKLLFPKCYMALLNA